MAQRFSSVEVLPNRRWNLGFFDESGWNLRAHVVIGRDENDRFYTAPDNIEQGTPSPIRQLSNLQSIALDAQGKLTLNGSPITKLPHRTPRFTIKNY